MDNIKVEVLQAHNYFFSKLYVKQFISSIKY